MLAAQTPELSDAEYRKLVSKPVVKSADMSPEMSSEAIEVMTMAVDKFINVKNYEAAAQLIKNSLDKKFGASWHCAIGEGFGFEITYQKRNMIYMYYGQLGVLAYKC
ncbi:dynein light chain type 1-domain-containing protein [Tribonema minus]|uniref:Dynein light chain n=1 Tax=Tribonema minus TaxID=303371 RepID=A0A836CH10_9STRA|nr:dynein light chain type 1-domain-containing protein [Tribonema minus]